MEEKSKRAKEAQEKREREKQEKLARKKVFIDINAGLEMSFCFVSQPRIHGFSMAWKVLDFHFLFSRPGKQGLPGVLEFLDKKLSWNVLEFQA